jgi:CheY-like chemotaxis protein
MSESLKILVVEDNDFVRMQIVKFLQEDGYEVLEAVDGDSALEVMANNKTIALSIVDIRMEPVGGFEFVQILREREIGFPVIFVTGDDTTDVLQESAKLGVSAVLMKPVMKERLLQMVSRAVGSYRQAQG